MYDMYEPEQEFGNIEYKSSLVDKSVDRVQKLASQMRFRVDEGEGEAIYVIGVSDDGSPVGVSDDDFTESFNNLSLAARENKYSVTMLVTKTLKNSNKVCELLVREKNDKKYIDIKVAVAGTVDSGKSSLLGVLTTGKNDDGRGSARLSIFNFKHEISSGRTSSIAHHILGFDDRGEIVNYDGLHKKSWPEIVKDSSKIISFYDLCGHEKYFKTTIRGLSSSYPDICLILVGGNMGVSRVTYDHIFLCVSLKIPFCIVVTKIDICKNRKNVFMETIQNINKLLKIPGIRRIPYKISNKDDVILCSKNIHSESIVPLFYVSNTTGQGIGLLKQFLNLSSKNPKNADPVSNEVEMHIDTTFSVPGVGTVVGGQLISGKIKVGDKLLMGPTGDKYTSIQVRSIHCKRVPMEEIKFGSYVCLGLKKVDRKNIRRGHVIISSSSDKIVATQFTADIKVLKSHSTTIKKGYEPVVHFGSMRQTAKLIEIKNKINARESENLHNDNILRTGDKAECTFKFTRHSEYIKAGTRIIFAEGKVKVIGEVK
jgi:GTPase